MAKQVVELKCRVILPWWWKIYVYAAWMTHDLGVVDVDPNVVADFVLRHVRVEMEKS